MGVNGGDNAALYLVVRLPCSDLELQRPTPVKIESKVIFQKIMRSL